MIKKFNLITLFLIGSLCFAEVVDKTALTVGSKMYTQSQIDRIFKTLDSRKKLAPIVYAQVANSIDGVKNFLVKEFVIEDQMRKQGIKVTNAMVEEQINQTAGKLKVSKFGFTQFLNQKGISFSEYFDMTKSMIQLRYFNSNIIAPLISISESEIRQIFLKEVPQAKAQSYKYKVVDYVFTDKLSSREKSNIPSILKQSMSNETLIKKIPAFEKIDLGEIASDEVQENIGKALSKTKEKTFSKGLEIDGKTHFFYIASKNVSESELYEKSKPQIRNYLIVQRAAPITNSWIAGKIKDYHIKKH